MNPPPPILPQQGSLTARAYPTATAASTALPFLYIKEANAIKMDFHAALLT